MIDAKDSRIGNLVIDEFGDVRRLAELRKNSVEFEYGIVDEIKNLKPIPLTEEWLKRLGFEASKKKGRYGNIYKLGIIDYNYVIERDWHEYPSHFFGIEYTDSPRESDNWQVYMFAFDIKHIHQLQNLYHALTGQELTIHEAPKEAAP